MALLKKGTFEFTDILADGYSIAEDVYRSASNDYTVSGYPKRVFYRNPVTTITISLNNLDDSTLAAYLAQLTQPDGTFDYWSPKIQGMRRADFYIELSAISVTGEGDGSALIMSDYTVTLTQKGAAVNV